MTPFYLEKSLVDNLRILKTNPTGPIMHYTTQAVMTVLINQA